MSIQATNLPQENSSNNEVRSFFDNYFVHQITFPTNQIDAVVGFFMKRNLKIPLIKILFHMEFNGKLIK